MKKFNYIFLIALTAMLTLTSCDKEFWYDIDNRLVGEWSSTFARDGHGTYDLVSNEVDCFTFYDNNRGVYGYYISRSGWNEWVEVEFRWEADRYERVAHISYADGKFEDIFYDFDSYGNLLISRNYSFNNYIGYEYHNYNSDLLGRWKSEIEAEGSNSWYINQNEMDSYQFDYNRTGTYHYYNKAGQWTSVGFIWSEDSSRRSIYVRYDDGVTETLYYTFSNSYMLLSRQSNFYNYVGYISY